MFCAGRCRVNRAVLLLELVVPVVTAVQLQACPTQLCWHPSSAAWAVLVVQVQAVVQLVQVQLVVAWRG